MNNPASRDDGAPDRSAHARAGSRRMLRHAAIAAGVAAAFLLLLAALWYTGQVLLLFFASVLVAILLRDGADQLCRVLPVAERVALPLVVLLAALVLGGTGWLLAPSVSEQAQQLWERIPLAVQKLRETIEQHTPFGSLAGALPEPEQALKNGAGLLERAGVVFGGTLEVLGHIAVVAFMSLYFAASPRTYTGGLLRLVPPARRARAGELFERLGDTLTRWLRGKLLSMLVVGLMTWGGLALLGLPLATTLGIVAGLLDFIPYLGPVLAAVPAVLIAFTVDPAQALYVLLLFVAVQAVEGYVLLPLVERNTVCLPPALTIGMQVLMGAAFGLAGVAMATPLTAVAAVVIGMLYIEDVLGEKSPLGGQGPPDAT